MSIDGRNRKILFTTIQFLAGAWIHGIWWVIGHMTFECKVCGSNLEPNARFCACGSSKDAIEVITLKDISEGIKLGKTCCRCRVDLSPNKRIYHLSESSGCLVFSLEYCKECYKAELIERAKQKQIDEEAEKIARARCNKCEKPFPGLFRKKRFAVNAHWGLTRDYYCKDCFQALPKNEILDDPNDRLTSDPWA